MGVPWSCAIQRAKSSGRSRGFDSGAYVSLFLPPALDRLLGSRFRARGSLGIGFDLHASQPVRPSGLIGRGQREAPIRNEVRLLQYESIECLSRLAAPSPVLPSGYGYTASGEMLWRCVERRICCFCRRNSHVGVCWSIGNLADDRAQTHHRD